MPELPEVETVCRELAEKLSHQPVVKHVRLTRSDIRFKIPKNFSQRLQGQRFVAVYRRAKYILFYTPEVIFLNHLGMTGSWRFRDSSVDAIESLDIHEHCFIDFEDGSRMVYRDPRRFGVIDLIEIGQEKEHRLLTHLGVEPLDDEAFSADFLFSVSRRRNLPVKTFIMDQHVVVGIGNIYASEILYRSAIKPSRKAERLTQMECEKIVKVAREVLNEAIKAGGSSIRDYRQASGNEGAFQSAHLVYGRAGQKCCNCQALIKSKIIGGRSTFWCSKCQS